MLCVGALVGYLAIPTYPTYDSYYALIWGRDVLHLHLPVFQVYRAPTEHPLAIAFGVLASMFGQAGDRVMILGAIASFVALVAGLYRLGRLTFGPLVGSDRGSDSVHALRLRVLRGAGLPGLLLHGAGGVGGGAGGGKAAPGHPGVRDARGGGPAAPRCVAA